MKNENQIKSAEAVEYSFNKVFFGLFALIYGLAFLINYTGLVSLNVNLYLLWPLFIIFIGLSFFRKRDVISTSLGSTIATLCVALVSISFMSSIPQSSDVQSVFPVSIEKGIGVEKAKIDINAGAGEVSIYAIESGNLVKGEVQSNLAEVKIDSQISDSIQNVEIGMSGTRKWFSENLKNQFYIGIDNNTPVILNINSGASNNNIDLTGIKVQSVALHTGASNVNLTMGGEVDSADVLIEAGASSISLNFPKMVGVKMYIESGMSSQDLTGFVSTEKNTYQSSNYESAEKKISVSVKMGMASLMTNWYEPENKETVLLYYFNQLKDMDNTCGLQFVSPVQRQIYPGGNIIKSAIEELLKGNLTAQEKALGLVTEYPNPAFKLLNSSLDKNGRLVLEFTEVPGLTNGSSCKTGVLMQEILKTVRQFPEVKSIVFKPDTLFEP
jgi:spore germination protein GerM